MKKTISLLMSAALVCTGFVMPAHGAGLEDYTPGKMNANIIPDASAGGGYKYFGQRDESSVSLSNNANPSPESGTIKLYTTAEVGGDAWRQFQGLELNSANLGDDRFFSPEAGKNYVFKMSLKDVSESGAKTYFGASMNDTYSPANIRYTKEYSSDGLLIGKDWTDFKGTISLPSTYKPEQNYGKVISIGFKTGTESGAAVLLDVSKKDSVYLAEEQAYDIKLTPSSAENELYIGSSASFGAAVLNQIGTEGYLKQNFVWNVFEEDRETIAKGFEVTPDSTTKNATVKVSDSAEEGKYYVLAYSTDYSMVRTYEINVKQPNQFLEYSAPKMNENIIPNAVGYTYFSNRDNSAVSVSNDKNPSPESGTIKIYTTAEVGGDAWRQFQGLELNSAQLGNNRYFTPKAGTNYVLKMSLKDISESNVKAYFGASMNDTYNPVNIRYTKEYGSDGLLVGKDWTDFKGTISLPSTYNADQNFGKVISIGFKMGTESGAAVLLDVSKKDSVYLAEEQLYDITLKMKDEPEAIRVGDTITLNAEVVNQIGAKGTFLQNFKWFAANEEKTEKVDGFTFSKNGDTESVKIDESVTPGTYYIYAESTDYSGMRRALKINVLKALISDKENISDNTADAKKVVITSNSESDVIKMTDEYKLSASVLNQAGEKGELSQEFNWYIINSDLETTAKHISAEKIDDANIKISVSIYAEPGVYYAVAEPVKYKGIRKIYKFTVDKPTAKESALEMINSQSAQTLEDNLKEYLEVFGVEDKYLDNADMSVLADMVAKQAQKGEFTTENINEKISKLIIISLYNSNPNNVDLYDENGDFIYRDALGIDNALKGTTLADVFDEIMSTEGRTEVQKALSNYKSEDEFFSALFEQIILKAIEKPEVLGTEYIGSILTKENAEKADINISKYLSLSSKGAANKTLARKSYTKESLEKAVSNLSSSQGNSNGSSGGSSHGSGGITQTPQILPDVKKDEYGGFSDVAENHWAYDEIYHLKQLGVVSGTDGNNFNPENSVTREEFIKMFIDAFGYEKTDGELPYEDVVFGAWYVPYLKTAYDNGLINGVSPTRFGVGMPITRQDICVVVARAMGIGADDEAELSFTDSEDIADYAKTSVSYLVDYGVINGFGDGSFKPMSYCTRAQAAKIICTLINLGGVTE